LGSRRALLFEITRGFGLFGDVVLVVVEVMLIYSLVGGF